MHSVLARMHVMRNTESGRSWDETCDTVAAETALITLSQLGIMGSSLTRNKHNADENC